MNFFPKSEDVVGHYARSIVGQYSGIAIADLLACLSGPG
jgi:hypothetical protein